MKKETRIFNKRRSVDSLKFSHFFKQSGSYLTDTGAGPISKYYHSRFICFVKHHNRTDTRIAAVVNSYISGIFNVRCIPA